MALPKLNQEGIKDFQRDSLRNQAEIASKIDSGVGVLHKELKTQSKSLGRIDKWLSETYELHREYYQAQDELMREQRRALKGGAFGVGYGSGRGGGGSPSVDKSQTNDVIDAITNAIEAATVPLLALYGTKKVAEVAKAATQAKQAAKTASAKTKTPTDVPDGKTRAKPGSIIEKGGKRYIAGVDGKPTAIEADKAKQSDIDRIKKAAAQQADEATKVAEKAAGKKPPASTVDEVVKASRKLTPLSKVTKVFNTILPPLAFAEALAVNIKDGWDIAKAGLDNDIGTEIQKEDIGGVVGGAIGGAIGIIGGPLGIAFGASIGNMIGEYIGGKFDDDFTDNFAIATTELDAKSEAAKNNLSRLKELREKGLINENQYLEQKIEIEKDMAFYGQMNEQRKNVDNLLQERRKAADEYNTLSKQLLADERAGLTITQSMRDAVNAAEKRFKIADEKFDEAAKRFEAEFDEELALKKAISNKIYDKVYFGKSKVDFERAEGASLGELRAILADKDLSGVDKQKLENLIARRTGTPERLNQSTAQGLQSSFNAAVSSGNARAMSEIISSVQQLGGESAVAALTKGNLTDTMLKQPRVQSTSSATSSAIGIGGINYQSYAMKVGQRESSGQYGIVGGAGGAYLGKYQLGAIALEDAGFLKAGSYAKDGGFAWRNPDNWIGGMNAEKFLNSPSAQESAMQKYTRKNLGYLKSYGVISSASSPGEVAGYLAAAHLLGAKEIATKGISNADAFGTKGTEYFRLGSGSQGLGSISPSGTGSVSGGNSGYSVNAGSKINSVMSQGGGGPIVVNNNNIDNSQTSSVSNNTSLPATATRGKTTGVRNDYRYDPVLAP